MESIILTNNLTKKYKDKTVVDNVNMHINKGDVYGFVGENGAGKTTVIRLITGLIRKSAGSYSIFGVSDSDKKINEVKSAISAIVESPSLYLNLDAKTNLEMQANILGIKLGSRAEDILKMVGLSKVINEKKKVSNFSLGMRQRLGIAMALVGNPKLIILDEPMNGLDPEGIVEIRELILKLNREYGITFIISSHILGELGKVATKYGFIHQGRLIEEVTQEELELKCQKSLELKVDNLDNCVNVLYNLDYTDLKVINNHVIVYGDYDIEKIVIKLAQNNIKIMGIKSNEEGIEEYYLRVMGGLKHV